MKKYVLTVIAMVCLILVCTDDIVCCAIGVTIGVVATYLSLPECDYEGKESTKSTKSTKRVLKSWEYEEY